MSFTELIVDYLNTPYLLIAGFVVMLVIAFQYFRKNRFPVNDMLQGNNLEREFGLSLVGLEDEVQMRNNDPDDERSAFAPSVFSSDSTPAILVVEPNADIRISITNALLLNYRVLALGDGSKAFQKACEMIPDLIIVNTYVGGMEGVTLCETLKSTEATNHIPVVMLTAKDEIPGNPGESHLKADAVLVKPFDARELLLCVRNLIDLRKRLQTAFRDQLSAGPHLMEYAPAEARFFDKLFKSLENNFHNPDFGPEALAREFSLTKMQLYRKLKALTNRSPGDMLRSYRIDQAKMLLMHSEGEVSLVARQCGFSNVATFTKVFKEYTGISPLEFSIQPKATVDPIVE
jgi:DNA-binding response OmpR family regulator